jgi:SagB-type dehydrogenase family enzyme
MNAKHLIVMSIMVGILAGTAGLAQTPPKPADEKNVTALLPVTGELAKKYQMSVTEALAKRRSQRAFAQRPLTNEELSLLCWAAQGITDDKGHRTAPSARAMYPLVVYVVTEKGMGEYVPSGHSLKEIKAGDMKEKLFSAARQNPFKSSAAVFVIAMDATKAREKMRESAEKCCFLEAGHVAQNILLQATAMDLAGVPATGFDAKKVTEALGLLPGQEVVYLVPVGPAK